ncbi:MAG: protease modulator HflC [Planctomycetota bacterium]|nr:protease modulator HflC [Planctomycetota bacterium]
MKKHVSLYAMGGTVVVVLLLYMVTFTVRFDQAAVVTTFGRAGEDAVKNADGASAGLYWKWPAPIQQVRYFDARMRTFETRLEQMTTRDNHTLIFGVYVSWSISDPLAFYQRVGGEEKAEPLLESRLREANALVSQYAFDDLTNVDPQRLKLGEVEERVREMMSEEVAKQGYGIEVHAVGLRRMILPEDVTRTVFDRMRETRQRLAQSARSAGDAEASRIRSEAETAAKAIESFAELRAQAIRAEGKAAAAEYYDVFQKNEDFAIFLRQIETLKQTLEHNSTFLLDMQTTPFNLLKPETPAPKE